MRKIIVGAQVSMDGVMQAPGGFNSRGYGWITCKTLCNESNAHLMLVQSASQPV
jgi:hypothetical protein